MTQLCASIMVESLEQARRDVALAAEAGAETVELRLDHFNDPALVQQLLELIRFPSIATCRPGWPEELVQAIGTRATYLDIEQASHPLLDIPRDARPGVILSTHDFQSRPARLSNVFNELNSSKADVVKIAWLARSIRENIETFELLQHRQKPTIALCMGEAGLVSRVLAKKFGAFLTFASLRKLAVTAPGQPTIDELKRLYRWDSIEPGTKVFGVVGSPIAHSLSPAIHNAAFDATGYNGVYLPMLVENSYESFKAFMISFVEFAPLDLTGLSITIPHKENALRYLIEVGAEVDACARSIGAVNTVHIDRSSRNQKPALRGYNTDAGAILHVLRNNVDRTLGDLRIAVIGAGGTARTAVAILTQLGATVVVYNRTREKAEALAKEFNGRGGRVVAARLEKLCDSCCHVFINCTPIGMHPNIDASPLGEYLPNFSPDTLVFDTVYNPAETRLMEQARTGGARVVGGAEMLLWQAGAQFRIWTGRDSPTPQMRKAFDDAILTSE